MRYYSWSIIFAKKIHTNTLYFGAGRLVKYTRFSFFGFMEIYIRWGERFSILFYFIIHNFFFYFTLLCLPTSSFSSSFYIVFSILLPREYKYLCTKLYRFSVTGENNTLLYCVTFSLVQQVWLIFSPNLIMKGFRVKEMYSKFLWNSI